MDQPELFSLYLPVYIRSEVGPMIPFRDFTGCSGIGNVKIGLRFKQKAAVMRCPALAEAFRVCRRAMQVSRANAIAGIASIAGPDFERRV